MKFYIPFGDYSHDGHGQYLNVLVSAPSMEGVVAAQKFYEEKYGKWFWEHFADEYGCSSISQEVEQALLDTNYPVKNFIEWQEDKSYDNFTSLKEVFSSSYWKVSEERTITLNTCVDMFIWLLNAQGAQIEREEDYPSIGWKCAGFKSVGYGCFWD